jgi:hypothetical protein
MSSFGAILIKGHKLGMLIQAPPVCRSEFLSSTKMKLKDKTPGTVFITREPFMKGNDQYI